MRQEARRRSGRAEHHSRRQDAPEATQSAHSGTDGARGRQRHPPPPGTLSRHPRGRRRGTRCRRWCRTTRSHSRTRSPTRRATGHDRRHRVRSIHPSHTMPIEGAQMPHRARSEARGTATNPPRREEPQPPRMSRRRCAVYLYEYGSTAQQQSRKPARRNG